MSYLALRGKDGSVGSNIFVLDTSDNTICFLTDFEFIHTKDDLAISIMDYDPNKMETLEFKNSKFIKILYKDSYVHMKLVKVEGEDTAKLNIDSFYGLEVSNNPESFYWKTDRSLGGHSYRVPEIYAKLLLTNDVLKKSEVSRLLSTTCFAYGYKSEVGYEYIRKYLKDMSL